MTNHTIFDILCDLGSMNKFMHFKQFIKTIKQTQRSRSSKALNISLPLLPFSNSEGDINA
jgi:hypothetical protein